MSRAVAVLFALGLLVAYPTAVRSQTTAPAGYGVVARAHLYSGVEYVKLARAKGPVVAHVAHVLPGAPVDLQVVNAHDRIPSSAKELETTSSMCERVRCIAGVNGDFHRFGVPTGAVVAGGRMLRSPDPARPQLTVTNDGRLVAGTLPWTGSVTAGHGHQLAVSTVNAAPPANGLALFTPEHGPATEASPRVELVVRAAGVGRLNQATDLQLAALRTGGGPIPADGAVLSGDGSAGQQLRELWTRRHGTAPARLLISSPVDATVSLGVEPVVLRDGKRALPWRDPNVINPRQPHTLVGWNREGHVYLVAVDGRQPASEGVNMAEAADFLVSLGVTDAVSLDGGGGTVFVAGGSVWNRPSDNDPARPGHYVERGAPNAFVVMARPGAPLPPEAPPAPPSAGGPAPGQIRPLSAAPEAPDSGADGTATGPAPWPDDPAAAGDGIGQFGPSLGVGGPLAPDELPVGPAAAGSTAGRRGQAATPTDGAVESAGPHTEDDSPVDQGRSGLPGDDDRRRADRSGDRLEPALSAAGSRTDPAPPPDKSGSTLPKTLRAALALAVVTGAISFNRHKVARPHPAPPPAPQQPVESLAPASGNAESPAWFTEVRADTVLIIDPKLLLAARAGDIARQARQLRAPSRHVMPQRSGRDSNPRAQRTGCFQGSCIRPDSATAPSR
jgi:hypothetical protein